MGSTYRSSTSINRTTQPNKILPIIPNAGHGGSKPSSTHSKPNYQGRPNADPELREFEQRQQQRGKRPVTGIPRTFLNLSSQQSALDKGGDDNGDGTMNNDNVPSVKLLQPNTIGFQALI